MNLAAGAALDDSSLMEGIFTKKVIGTAINAFHVRDDQRNCAEGSMNRPAFAPCSPCLRGE
jgi:hypothetical protein